MKKTRLLAFLLTACLATTCFLSGTVAKYSTTGAVKDAARVAKWGVTVGASGSLFNTSYDTDDKDVASTITASVTSTKGDVVAPGTKDTTGMKFELKGTAEVAVDVSIVITGANGPATDIFLAAGTYTDYTSDNSDSTFTTTQVYNPIVFTLQNGSDEILVSGTLAQIENYLEALSGQYEAGTDLAKIGAIDNKNDGTYKLTWAWDYKNDAIAGENSSQVEADKADTLLGNLAVGNNFVTGVSADAYSTNVEFNIVITVTQVD